MPRLPSVASRPDLSGRSVTVSLPHPPARPLTSLARRLMFGVGLLALVTIVVMLDRGGYRDSAGDSVTLLDAVYYSTVSVTTTGYGDIVPVTDRARLLNAVFVTPARVLFLILLVSTTLEVLTERFRAGVRRRRWRDTPRDHFVIAGYGVKGKSAVRVLLGRGVQREQIVVIDSNRGAIEQANAEGIAAILGSASSTAVLEEAGVREAHAVVVAPERDDTAVLITLTARQMTPRDTTVVAAAREEENAELLRQSGADTVITSAENAGRLLGIATESPRVVHVLEDLLSSGIGLDIDERDVEASELGPCENIRAGHLIVAIVRHHEVIRFDDPRAEELEAGDRVLYLHGADRP